MSEQTIIKLTDPLPCGILGGAGLPCGHPAAAAYADPIERYPSAMAGRFGAVDGGIAPGHWVILPVCEDCARASAAVYSKKGIER